MCEGDGVIVDISGYIGRVEEVLQNTLVFLFYMVLFVVVVAFILLYLEFHIARQCLRCR